MFLQWQRKRIHIFQIGKNLNLPQIYAPCCIWQSSPFVPSLVQVLLSPAAVRHGVGSEVDVGSHPGKSLEMS